MKEDELFDQEVKDNIQKIRHNKEIQAITDEWVYQSILSKYSYNFKWLGRPIIQYPADLVAMQEIIWKSKPDLIIETGIARGGSMVFYASMLAILDIVDKINGNDEIKRKVLGIDIDIREHNRIEIENHPFCDYIDMIEGSSTDDAIIVTANLN